MGTIGYFNNHALDPRTGISADPRFSTGFDAVEVFNGLEWSVREEMALEDWCNLTNRGLVFTAVGNSDSHRTAWNGAGFPRTFVGVSHAGSPGTLPPEELAAAVRARRAVVSYGPYIEFGVNGTVGIGDLITDTDGEVDLDIKVSAPLWMDVDRIEVWANGSRLLTLPPDTTGTAVRFLHALAVPVVRDTWFHVRAVGSRSLWPVAPGVSPYAVTNGIFVDHDGNGRFDPIQGFGPTLLEVEPAAIEFGAVPLGAEARRALTLRNRGGAPLTVREAAVTNGEFRLEGAFPVTLGFQEIATLIVAYRPASPVGSRGTLVIRTDEGEVRVPLLGSPSPPR
jgi:hypothetical protein